jgi:uncharacterized protein
MKEAIDDIKKRVIDFMTNDFFPGHDYQHVMRVYNIARRIGKEEGANMLILEPAVLMHDLGRVDTAKDPSIKHAEASLTYAEKILADTDYYPELHGRILHIIKYHSWKNSDKAKTLEHKIMQDSDKLDALGAIGIMRCLTFSGARGRTDYNPDNMFGSDETLLDDKKYSIDHFYSKLFKLKDLLHTPTARKIAENRHRFMENYLNRMEQEIKGEL